MTKDREGHTKEAGDLLWAQLSEKLDGPLLPIVEQSVRALASLPGMADWHPRGDGRIHPWEVVLWGIPWTRLPEHTAYGRLRREFAQGILLRGRPDPDDLAEVHAAALLFDVGAATVLPLPVGAARTVDFVTSWGVQSEMEVEVEVTCADEKEEAQRRCDQADRLKDLLESVPREFDVILHAVLPLESAELERIQSAARDSPEGEVTENAGRWQLRMEKPDREPTTVLVGGTTDDSPGWWPEDVVTGIVLSVKLVESSAAIAPPQIRVYYDVPKAAYINPIQNKVERFQGSKRRPFIIAIDTTRLMGALSEYRELLPAYFPQWRVVSGILAFQRVRTLRGTGWDAQFYPNEHAQWPLPEGAIRQPLEPGTTWEYRQPLVQRPTES